MDVRRLVERHRPGIAPALDLRPAIGILPYGPRRSPLADETGEWRV